MKTYKYLLLGSSLGCLALLFFAAAQENVLAPWRRIQEDYRFHLPADRRQDFEIKLRQIVVPELSAMDRCVTCHAGMSPEAEAPGTGPLFGPHPKTPHDPARYGCVVCHGGQARATVAADAHGEVLHWPEPMLPPGYAQAGCGGCHTPLGTPTLEVFRRGESRLERYDCLACHSLGDRGGTLRPGQDEPGAHGPDLSLIGAAGFPSGWYEDHLAKSRAAASGPWKDSMGPVPDDDRALLESYLGSLAGAPRLAEAKALFHSKGCMGCHQVNGIGGDDGPGLSRAGQKDPGQIDFSNVRGEHSPVNWHREHLRDPAAIVPGSLMPELGLSDSEVELLTFYLMSLRRLKLPEEFWPADRLLALRLGVRGFAGDGETIYQAFCSACHGGQGRGRRYPGQSAFPDIANPDFLELASDEFIMHTIERGRPGRRMPAWGAAGGGLTTEEMAAAIRHIREMSPGRDETDVVAEVFDPKSADPREGERLYAARCASCHGERGSGGDGPMLANPALLESADEDYLFGTIARGRRDTAMPGFGRPSPAWPTLSSAEMSSIVAYILSLKENDP